MNQSSELFTGTLAQIDWLDDYSAKLCFEEFDTEFSFALNQPWEFEMGDSVLLFGIAQSGGFIRVIAAKNQGSGAVYHKKPLPRWLASSYYVFIVVITLLNLLRQPGLLSEPQWGLFSLLVIALAAFEIVKGKQHYSSQTQRALQMLGAKP